MAGSVNKVFLMGNLTRDPDLRYTPSGAAVTTLGIALNRTYTTKEGERREEVTFVDVTVWNRQAETCAQYLKKGRPVHIEGFLKLDTWDDKTTGQKRSQLKVEAENVQFLGGRDDAGGRPSSEDDEAPVRETRRPAPANGPAAPARGGSSNGPSTSSPARRPPAVEPEADDDIPF